MMKRAVACVVFLGWFACGSGGGGDGGSLLDGQIVYEGDYPAVVTVSFTGPEGEAMTTDIALEGWVSVLVYPDQANLADLQSAAENLGGVVIDAIPRIGLYVIEAPPEDVPTVVSAMAEESYVFVATPTLVALPTGIAVLDNQWEVDFGASHGECMAAVAARSGAMIHEVDGSVVGLWDEAGEVFNLGNHAARHARKMIEAIEAAWYRDERIVAVSSLLPMGNKCLDVPTCELGWKLHWGTFVFLLSQSSRAVRDNGIIVSSGGNAGVDITDVLDLLSTGNFGGWQRMRIVGAAEYKAPEPFTEYNYAARHMVFAPAVDVVAGECNVSGTSFAGPEVARTIEEVWRKYPSLESLEILDAFEQSLGPNRVIGTDPATGRAVSVNRMMDRAACKMAEECPDIEYTVCSWSLLENPMTGPVESCSYTDSSGCDLQGGAPLSVSGDLGTTNIGINPAIFAELTVWKRTGGQMQVEYGIVSPSPLPATVEYARYDYPDAAPGMGSPTIPPLLEDNGLYMINAQVDDGEFRYAQMEFVLGADRTTADCDPALH